MGSQAELIQWYKHSRSKLRTKTSIYFFFFWFFLLLNFLCSKNWSVFYLLLIFFLNNNKNTEWKKNSYSLLRWLCLLKVQYVCFVYLKSSRKKTHQQQTRNIKKKLRISSFNVLTMHNVLKSSTDWKQVEKKFKEENNTKNRIQTATTTAIIITTTTKNTFICIAVCIYESDVSVSRTKSNDQHHQQTMNWKTQWARVEKKNTRYTRTAKTHRVLYIHAANAHNNVQSTHNTHNSSATLRVARERAHAGAVWYTCPCRDNNNNQKTLTRNHMCDCVLVLV